MDGLTLALANWYTNSQRLAYTESGPIVVLPEMRLLYAKNSNEWYSSKNYPNFNKHPLIKLGEKITVIWDRVPYECTVKRTGDSSLVMYIGNLSLVYAAVNSGEPFCIYIRMSFKDVWVYTTEPNAETSRIHTLEIMYDAGETVHQIDKKFIPTTEITQQTAEELSNRGLGGITHVKKFLLEEMAFFTCDWSIQYQGFKSHYKLLDVVVELPPQELHVIFDGAHYKCAHTTSNSSYLHSHFYGNAKYRGYSDKDTGEPFYLGWDSGAALLCCDSGYHTIGIYIVEETETKINSRFIPMASETYLGGVKAPAATEDMTESVGINSDGMLVTHPASRIIPQLQRYVDKQRITTEEEKRITLAIEQEYTLSDVDAIFQ